MSENAQSARRRLSDLRPTYESIMMDDIASNLHSPDLAGEHYIATLGRLHEVLRPKTYLEIGVLQGDSLKLARCASIAIDPAFHLSPDNLEAVFSKPELHLYQMGSDDFFDRHNPRKILGAPLDMAFLDGMHRCEFLLRDFINTEKYCKRNSIIALHDCLPVEPGIASRVQSHAHSMAAHRAGWWAGDVWRTSMLLRRTRPDLQMTVLDSMPTGLVLLTNLDPSSNVLSDNYAQFIREMLDWDLNNIGIPALFAEMEILPASRLQEHEDITQRFGCKSIKR